MFCQVNEVKQLPVQAQTRRSIFFKRLVVGMKVNSNVALRHLKRKSFVVYSRLYQLETTKAFFHANTCLQQGMTPLHAQQDFTKTDITVLFYTVGLSTEETHSTRQGGQNNCFTFNSENINSPHCYKVLPTWMLDLRVDKCISQTVQLLAEGRTRLTSFEPLGDAPLSLTS